MKTKKIILAVAILIGGVLYTVDALNTNLDGQDTATRKAKIKIPGGDSSSSGELG